MVDYDYLSFMGGDCYLLAEVLHEITGLPLVGIWEGDELHHAAVYDPNADIYIDKRGELSEEEFVSGCRGTEIRPASYEDLLQAVSGQTEHSAYGDEEFDYATEWAWDNLGDILVRYQ